MKFNLNFKRPLKNLNSFFLQNIIMNYYIFIIIYYEVAYIKVISAIYFCVNTYEDQIFWFCFFIIFYRKNPKIIILYDNIIFIYIIDKVLNVLVYFILNLNLSIQRKIQNKKKKIKNF